METRRASLEQCGIVRLSISGGGGGGTGGVLDAVRTVQAQIRGIMFSEEQTRLRVDRAAGGCDARQYSSRTCCCVT